MRLGVGEREVRDGEGVAARDTRLCVDAQIRCRDVAGDRVVGSGSRRGNRGGGSILEGRERRGQLAPDLRLVNVCHLDCPDVAPGQQARDRAGAGDGLLVQVAQDGLDPSADVLGGRVGLCESASVGAGFGAAGVEPGNCLLRVGDAHGPESMDVIVRVHDAVEDEASCSIGKHGCKRDAKKGSPAVAYILHSFLVVVTSLKALSLALGHTMASRLTPFGIGVHKRYHVTGRACSGDERHDIAARVLSLQQIIARQPIRTPVSPDICNRGVGRAQEAHCCRAEVPLGTLQVRLKTAS